MTDSHPGFAPGVAISGGGHAGVMAGEVVAEGGVKVDLYDGMPSVGRKCLLAGVGGMNITHSEAKLAFVARYGPRQAEVAELLDARLSPCFYTCLVKSCLSFLCIKELYCLHFRWFPGWFL